MAVARRMPAPPAIMEGVAQRAGTSRPVLARRWPTRLELVDLGPETFYGMAADYFADPALIPDFQAQVLQTGNDIMTAILRRAAERGEARGDIPPRVATLPIDLLRHELLIGPGDEHAITEIVDQAFFPLVSR
jgi:hypothetical protein